MAVASSSSSSSSSSGHYYDVFINFRGEDTRKIFVGHLYRALEQKAIHTFVDSEELRKGNDLSKLLNAIDDSRLSIVVLSEHYASSTWCLKELVKILECMDAQNQIVVPVFYEVDPSGIRNLKGSYAQAFAKHEDDSDANREEVHAWKTALTRATNLSGWDSRNYMDDGELIEKIVKDTFDKLVRVSSSKANGLVGMDYHLNKMYSLLELGVDDVRFIGIWGMGGIGKTTIAKAVYDEIACQFDHCCFLENVKEGFMKDKAQVQEDFLSRILKEKVPSTGTLSRGSIMIKERLGKKKVLLVLDDLDNITQIETLLGDPYSFGGGSRIILTTRYIHSFRGVEHRLYKPQFLSYDKAHELFMKYAFRTNKPSVEYNHLPRRAIEYAKGLPLALKVLGASLYNRSVSAWEDTLEKIKETPHREIQDVLRTSFDGLEASEKNIFLDVACFFRGDNKIFATNIMKVCGFFPNIGLGVLLDKALITIDDRDRLEMHDLLVEMGWKIGRASRLWNYEDISRVLTENTETEAVESIILDLFPFNRKEIYLNTEAFVSMKKLRLLKIYCSNSLMRCKQLISGDLKFLSHQLRLLVWHECPLKSLPSSFQPLNLVCIIMPHSHIEQFWEGTKPLGNLKSINVSDSHKLRKIPDCSQATNLETLNLNGCTSLSEVHPSISALKNLAFWSLKDCKVLETLPSSIYMKSLKSLDLSGCSNLERFPEIRGIMEELAELCLDKTAIIELPSSIDNLPGLVTLGLKGCKKLKRLPSSIHLKSLKSLILSGCSNLESFPEIRGILEELAELRLDETAIVELPSSIDNLPGLVTLSLKGCKELKRLPSSIHLKALKSLILSGCSNLDKFPEIRGIMKELTELRLDETAIVELPSSIDNLPGLVTLSLKGCKELQRLPSSIHLKSLKSLILAGCSNLERFPEIRGIMKELPKLCLDETAIVELPLSIDNLPGLVTLSLKGCKELKRLPNNIHLKSLKSLILSGCSNLDKFPEINEIMRELRELCLDETGIEELPSSIEKLTGLVTLSLKDCRELKSLPSSIHLKSLKSLILSGCSNLEKFPEIRGIMTELPELCLHETAIVELPSSIDNLAGLVTLSLKGCKELKRLPTSIHLKSLKSLILSGCSNLVKFPNIIGIMKELRELYLDETGIEELPSSIEKLTGLVTLSLKDCRELKILPISICQLKSLQYLILSGCSKFEVFPIIVEDMEELRELHLDGTSIKELFPSIERLKRLIFVNMRNCRSLVCLPDNIFNLSYLTGVTLSGCSNIYNLPENCGNSKSLLDLEVEGTGIKQLPLSLLHVNKQQETLSFDGSEEMTHPFPSWSSSSSNCLVGMVSHINQMKLLLSLDQVDIVHFVGVCGVGGIGKTTIASAVYDEIASQFEYHCFLENVKEGFTKKGETQMQKELLSRIWTEKVNSVGTLNRDSNMIMENLSKKKVLLVLDDVDDIAQIETLLGHQYSFGGGSRIIVTTRDQQILSGVNAITYCPGLLRPNEALVLFRQFAFRTIDPTTEYRRLSRYAIEFAQGLPLALKVLGSFLSRKSLHEWEDALEKFKKNSHIGVQYVLRTSFDGLDYLEKSIFLDVACFFKGMKKDYALTLLESCGFSPYCRLRCLIDRSLIAVSHRDKTLKMHDLLQDMGWEIIRQECLDEPGKRSRLWRYNDVHHVLTSYTGTSAVHVITLDLSNSKEVYLNAQAFNRMSNLRLLQIHDNGSMDCKQHVNGDFKFLSRELRCLIWHRFPLKSLPSNFHLKNLVDLDMCYSHLELLWEGTKSLKKLQSINLSHSPYLRMTSDVTKAPRLKKLILEGCTSLFKVHPSLLYHDTLVFLNLKGCRELKMLPSPICMRSLRTLDLSGCSNLEKFPEISGDKMELSEIDLDETAIKELPSSIGRLQKLQVLSMRNCRTLVSLPDSICNLAYLQQLYLAGCSELYNLPENLRNAQALTILEVQGSGIEKLPFFMTKKETVREGFIRVSGNVIKVGGASGGMLGGRTEFGGLKQLLELPE